MQSLLLSFRQRKGSIGRCAAADGRHAAGDARALAGVFRRPLCVFPSAAAGSRTKRAASAARLVPFPGNDSDRLCSLLYFLRRVRRPWQVMPILRMVQVRTLWQ